MDAAALIPQHPPAHQVESHGALSHHGVVPREAEARRYNLAFEPSIGTPGTSKEYGMRMLIRIVIPVESGNAAIQNGSFAKIMGAAIERLKPEAVYYVADNGCRSALMVIDLADSSDMPRVAEPFFLGLDAAITFSPVMTPADLEKGFSKMA
jgi:hypothetical protein